MNWEKHFNPKEFAGTPGSEAGLDGEWGGVLGSPADHARQHPPVTHREFSPKPASQRRGETEAQGSSHTLQATPPVRLRPTAPAHMCLYSTPKGPPEGVAQPPVAMGGVSAAPSPPCTRSGVHTCVLEPAAGEAEGEGKGRPGPHSALGMSRSELIPASGEHTPPTSRELAHGPARPQRTQRTQGVGRAPRQMVSAAAPAGLREVPVSR